MPKSIIYNEGYNNIMAYHVNNYHLDNHMKARIAT